MANVSVRYLDDYTFTYSLVASAHASCANEPYTRSGMSVGKNWCVAG